MNELKEKMTYSKGERVAIIVLLIVLIILLLFLFLPVHHKKPSKQALGNIDSLIQLQQKAIDKQKVDFQKSFNAARAEASIAESKITPFPFNPNDLSESKWQELGLTSRQIKNIKNYEANGGRFFRKSDLKKIYSISDEEYKILEPYIVIPSKKTISTFTEKPEIVKSEHAITHVELNSVDSVTLTQLPEIGAWYAHRILNYRLQLGGFIDKTQLLEVYGMDSVRYAAIEKYVSVADLVTKKIKINRDDFKTLLKHPYLDYEMVKLIVNHRNSKGMIKNEAQLMQVLSSTKKINPLLKYYVSYE